MGGVISSLCCKPSDSRPITSSESKAQSWGAPGFAGVGTYPAAADSAVRQRKASQLGHWGDITAKVPQVDTGRPAIDFDTNLRLLSAHAGKISLQNLEAAMREITQRTSADVESRSIARSVINRQLELSADQLRAMARGLCDARPKDLDAILSAAAPLASSLGAGSAALAFVVGALSTFEGRAESDGDRLDQQIARVLALRPSPGGQYACYFHSALLGALVHERGLEQISPAHYERICHAAAHHVGNENEAGTSFRGYIPGRDHSRPELARLHGKYKAVFETERYGRPVPAFSPEESTGDVARPLPPVPERPSRVGRAAPSNRPAEESKERGDSKGAGSADVFQREALQWFMAHPQEGRRFFADLAEARKTGR